MQTIKSASESDIAANSILEVDTHNTDLADLDMLVEDDPLLTPFPADRCTPENSPGLFAW
jgi:hypothetical protein